MARELWVLGVALSLAATLFGTLGKVFLKLAHMSPNPVMVQIAATVCVFLLNPVFDAMSYAYAAQSILAPMAGFSVVWNIVLAPYILDEQLSEHDVKGSAVIVLGCVLVGLSGSHSTPEHSSEEIYDLFKSAAFIHYVIIAVIAGCGLTWVIWTFNQRSGARRFAYGALSGLVGGNLFFLKSSVELLTEGGAIWDNVETYLIFVAALSTAGGGIFILNLGLKDYEAIYLVAIYQAFLIVIGSISGMIFFHENAGMDSWWQLCLYPLSIIMTVAGVIILSEKHKHDDDAHYEHSKLMEEGAPLFKGGAPSHGSIQSETAK
ncbi:hypothetical protein Poli38472_002362 [Pythium oligandrum]|uniref:Magnesium transporter n=1 Tax=Pythium oligandrum TaxID=41045 RepID=A0A8K1FI47_PYTOL|nr:hypothetical protein Poli38472_002362 [Pythium oligandrum]|eukprot:TMW63421.1 hypothetical protein Poli38472_002362 [Pythium oligandrum]